MRKDKVQFYTSEGIRLAGELYLPAGRGRGTGAPGSSSARACRA
ncbi:MAG: hypothetical protein V1789_10000 [PVC group bacterium]